MNFEQYLKASAEIASIEGQVLDMLRAALAANSQLNSIEIRAAKASLQTVIENCIGKAKHTLKEAGCPVIPVQARDAFGFLLQIGFIENEEYGNLVKAVGFRNAMIHEYMTFDQEVLLTILRKNSFEALLVFLKSAPPMDQLTRARARSFRPIT